jgi:copper(I)-binding protein
MRSPRYPSKERPSLSAAIALVVALLSSPGPASAAVSVPISITQAWSRPAIETGVVYLTLRNTSGKSDELIGAKTPIASHAELHQSMTNSGPMGEMASMHPVRLVVVPAHGSIVFQPGGYHIMLIGLKKPLRAGMSFPLELEFRNAGRLTTAVSVRPIE